ncbi:MULTISPECIES: nuclear transport factor 2 family protein [Sphingobium]|uniref:nuclear transport factor 2 family protein n=1 Tax=Sphingobium TaxID=165695 RepID=UPI00159CAD04|nr:nuclear transport factor 2 family protein [Sphingobium sp. 15-1]
MSADDRLALQELNYKYAYYVDSFQPDAWAQLFTPDGILNESDFFPDALFEGRDAIRAYGVKISETVDNIVHLISNQLLLELTPTRARGLAFCLVETMRKNGERIRFHVKYEDQFVKVGDSWLIANKTLRKSFPFENVRIDE